MSLNSAVVHALEDSEKQRAGGASPTYPAGLSAREVEVLRLLAAGMTNPQIAERLYVSRRTVNAHLHNAYQKLGTSTRAEAARFATEHDLL